MSRAIEVRGERFIARAWWDDRPRNPHDHGWFIEYQDAATGDTVDDSVKVWHPDIHAGPDDAEGVRVIATAYLERLEAVRS